jgi:hypothetical protein
MVSVETVGGKLKEAATKKPDESITVAVEDTKFGKGRITFCR